MLTDVHAQSLEHVGVSAQMDAAQSPGFVEVGVGTLEPFTALPQQALPHRLAVQTQLASNRSNRIPLVPMICETTSLLRLV